MYKLIIFDIDGTMIDTETVVKKSYNYAMAGNSAGISPMKNWQRPLASQHFKQWKFWGRRMQRLPAASFRKPFQILQGRGRAF